MRTLNRVRQQVDFANEVQRNRQECRTGHLCPSESLNIHQKYKPAFAGFYLEKFSATL
jgi:hypothetical protein